MKRVTELDRETLKYYARMAAESFVNDPVHAYATKNVERRKKFVYHFLLERLTSSNKCDVFYVDDEARALCVWRDAHNEYTVLDFLKCPNWVFLCYYIDSTVRTLMAYSHLDSKVFEKNTLIISPVFVDPKHQGKGIAKEMIMKGIEDCSYEDFNYALQVGVTAPFYLSKLFAPYFNTGASIVNISSSRDRMSQPNTESYTAAKGGIASLTHALAVSLAGKVRVNSISPGWIDTDYTVYEGPDAIQQPVHRVGNPLDIANMVLYLCSDKAGFITGENICIDGGMTKQMIYHDDHGWKLTAK